VVRGNSLVVPVTLSVQPWPGSSASDGGLAEDFAHDGLTNSQAKAQWRAADFTSPGQSQGTATATASVSSGAIASITVNLSGYGYSSAPTVQITDATGHSATATAAIAGGVVTAINVTAGGSGYSSSPVVTITGPAVGQSDIGTCTMPSTTQVTVTSTNANAQWIADYWDYSPTGHQGVVVIRSDTISGYTQTFTARIIGNTALTAGGTSTLTLDSPAPATTYNSYQIYGTAGGASFVYRRYKVADSQTAAQLANYFPYPVAYRNSDGTSATLVSTPAGTVFYSSNGMAPYEQSGIGVAVDPESGTVLTSKPTALVFSADGITPTPVDDFQAFLPVNTGALSTVYPASGYQGTAYTALGIERTKTITCLDWKDSSNSINMGLFAAEYLDSVKDIVYEGSIPYFGLLPGPLAFGHKVNISGSTYATGWESLNLPITGIELAYNERSGGTHYTTTLTVSNRREPFTGAVFARPSVKGHPIGFEAPVTAESIGETVEQALAANQAVQRFGGGAIGAGAEIGSIGSAPGGSPLDTAGQLPGALGGSPLTGGWSPSQGLFNATNQALAPLQRGYQPPDQGQDQGEAEQPAAAGGE
jgi:hypothetical protein